MAHFAEIDENGFVLRVLVVDNAQESRGAEFLSNDLGLGGNWVQTSYNANIRGQFAGVGYYYDSVLDEFIAPVIIEEIEEEVLEEVSAEKSAVLAKLGLTEDELKTILG